MSDRPTILAFAGSLRSDSYNKKLVRIAAQAARRAGADVTLLDLRELDLPMYDGDDEKTNGLPPGAKRLKKIMIEAHGFLIASPEYNSSISAALKNAIDWASRPEPNEKPLVAFVGKVAAIMAASPGALGGLRGLVHLRSILGNIQVIVLPDQKAVPKANEAFDESGALKDAKLREEIENLGAKLVHLIRKLDA